jgi:ribonuclease HI
MDPPCQGVHKRKAFPCPATRDWDVSKMIKECSVCKRYYMYCCQHRRKVPCHHFPLIFVDGACTNNGRPHAKAGIGVAYGVTKDDQFSIPVTDALDSFPLRSNQRAELLAAYSALLNLRDDPALGNKHHQDLTQLDSKNSMEPISPIIATDSEYVVKGITEWLPKWKVCFK